MKTTRRLGNAIATRSTDMTTSTFEKRTALFTRMGQLALVLALTGQTMGCDGGREGDRCVPVTLPNGSSGFSHNDCNDGLTCTTIVDPASGATCGESYCCPTNGPSSNPYCNASLIGPAPDGAAGICPLPPATPPSTSDAAGDVGTATDGPADAPAPEAASGDASGD